MSLLTEYLGKSAKDLEEELLKLIKDYNNLNNSYLLIYSSSLNKQIPDTAINMDDYYTIFNLLKNCKSLHIDIYIETPRGSNFGIKSFFKNNLK